MIYSKLFKAIKENWKQLKFYVLFFVVLYVFSLIMSVLKVSKVITYSIIAVCVIMAIVIYMKRSKRKVELRKKAALAKDYIGQKVLITEDINNELKTGKVVIGDDTWRAKSYTGAVLLENGIAEVKSTEDIFLVVDYIKITSKERNENKTQI